MTEAEWLAGDDPQAMLRWLGEPGGVSGSDPEGRAYTHRVTDRKLRLFACAAVRRAWHLLTDGHSRKAVEVAEMLADGKASEEVRRLAMVNLSSVGSPDFVTSGAYLAVHCVTPNRFLPCARLCESLSNALAPCSACQGAGNINYGLADGQCEACHGTGARCGLGRGPLSKQSQAALLRDVFGNPWSPIMRVGVDWGLFMHHDRHLLVYERWLTPTVLAVAHAAYDERPGRACGKCGGDGHAGRRAGEDEYACAGCGRAAGRYGHYAERSKKMECPKCPHCYGAGRIADGDLDPTNLSVLADALEDAGCDCGELLGHLRSPGPHVRGCWAVDLVLGKR